MSNQLNILEDSIVLQLLPLIVKTNKILFKWKIQLHLIFSTLIEHPFSVEKKQQKSYNVILHIIKKIFFLLLSYSHSLSLSLTLLYSVEYIIKSISPHSHNNILEQSHAHVVFITKQKLILTICGISCHFQSNLSVHRCIFSHKKNIFIFQNSINT